MAQAKPNKKRLDCAKYLAATTAVLRATNGKLSRHEADHLVALVIKEMHDGE